MLLLNPIPRTLAFLIGANDWEHLNFSYDQEEAMKKHIVVKESSAKGQGWFQVFQRTKKLLFDFRKYALPHRELLEEDYWMIICSSG